MKWFQGLKAHKRRSAGVALALLLGVGTLSVPAIGEESGTSDYLDPIKDINVRVETQDADLKEFVSKTDLDYDIYQIAEAQKMEQYDAYTFNLTANFTAGDLGVEDINAKDMDLTTWKKIAQAAADKILVTGKTITPVISGSFSEQVTLPDGINMNGGLYLLVVRPDSEKVSDYDKYVDKREILDEEGEQVITYAESDTLMFKFLPILFAAPSKTATEYTFETSDPGPWLYDLSFSLKADSEPRKGNLRIVKNLERFETREGHTDPATFVYQIEGYTEKNGQRTVVYSNVKSLVFKGITPPDPIELNDLPAGAKFTITEIYQGENYKPANPAYTVMTNNGATISQKMPVTIIAEDTVIVTFNNDWDDTYHGSGSVENVYQDDGEGRTIKESRYSTGEVKPYGNE